MELLNQIAFNGEINKLKKGNWKKNLMIIFDYLTLKKKYKYIIIFKKKKMGEVSTKCIISIRFSDKNRKKKKKKNIN